MEKILNTINNFETINDADIRNNLIPKFDGPTLRPINGYFPEDVASFIQKELNVPEQLVYNFLNARSIFYGSDCFDRIKDYLNIEPKQLRSLLKAEQHFANAMTM